MAKRRKKSKPVTEQGPKVKIKRDHNVIRKVHQLLHRIETVKTKSNDRKEDVGKLQIVNHLQEEINQLGGLDAYQSACKLGESRHGNINSAKWVVKKLNEFNIRPAQSEKLNLLDVGALSLNYEKQKWIRCTPIDLNPQAAGIQKADFFDYQKNESNVYDVIVLSLVLNFVGTPSRRGEMLFRCKQLCKDKGYLVIVLPRPCLDNSRYLTHDLLHEILKTLGFILVSSHNSPKLSFKMFQWNANEEQLRNFSKKLVRPGKKCNNFCITIKR